MALPKRFPDRDEVAAVRAEAEQLSPGSSDSLNRRLAGRIMAGRGHGGIAFFDLVDRSGKIQLVVQESNIGIPDVDLGDIVGVYGIPMKTKRGEPSLQVFDFYTLSKRSE